MPADYGPPQVFCTRPTACSLAFLRSSKEERTGGDVRWPCSDRKSREGWRVAIVLEAVSGPVFSFEAMHRMRKCMRT